MNILLYKVVFCPPLTDSLQSSLSKRLTTFSSFYYFLRYPADIVMYTSFQNSAHIAVVTRAAKAETLDKSLENVSIT